MKLSRFTTVVLLLFLAVNAVGQTPAVYNPFVPKNLDDPKKLIDTPVVESSIHRYWIYGDPNYTDTSTYVWYVENGAFISFDTLNGTWTTLVSQKIGHGYFIELPGISLDTVRNASEVWVRWNDKMGGDSTGYVAVYEESPAGCIIPDSITGFKHEMVLPPEVWFYPGNMEQCAESEYSVRVSFNNINDYSFPYKLKYSYPGSNGVYLNGELQINSRAELDASLSYTFQLPGVQDLNIRQDLQYWVTLTGLSDKFHSEGVIAPMKPPVQFEKLELIIHHLPQTGGMTMD